MKAFCSGFIEIQTLDGPKWIKDLKIGDLVLTHKCRYRKITKVSKMPNEEKIHRIFDIYFLVEDKSRKGGFREEGLHRITEDHLIFCAGTKKYATSIKRGEILNLGKGLKGRVISLLEIPKINHGDHFYYIEVEKDHSYFADNVCVCD